MSVDDHINFDDWDGTDGEDDGDATLRADRALLGELLASRELHANERTAFEGMLRRLHDPDGPPRPGMGRPTLEELGLHRRPLSVTVRVPPDSIEGGSESIPRAPHRRGPHARAARTRRRGEGTEVGAPQARAHPGRGV